MNAKIMCLIAVVAAAAFMSCSSDNAATAPEQVATFADLGECNSLSEGVTKQVAADGLYYKCVAGGWQETEWVPDNSGTLAGSVLLDSRDGQTYKTVTIGTQTWMAENLNYKMDGTICPSDSYCKTHTCHKYYGYLNYEYDHCSPLPDTTIWPDAGCYYRSNSALSACPSGWHLPSLDEWKILFEAVGGTDVAAKMLKASSGFCGDDGRNSNGTDAYGFNALPTGHCSLLNWGYYHSKCNGKTENGLCDDGRGTLYVPDQDDYIIDEVFPSCTLGGGAVFWASTYLGKVPCGKKESNFICESTEIDVYSTVSFRSEWHDNEPDDVRFETPDDFDSEKTSNQNSRLYSVRCVKD
ncbi:MAG: hypothetical protein IJ909_02405 [Fibrobacter sp.]|nr:hypothetical protein [Fibrobacter sp.]